MGAFERQTPRAFPASPADTVPATLDDMVAQLLAQLIEVYRQTHCPRRLVARLGHAAGEQVADLRDVLLAQVGLCIFSLSIVFPFYSFVAALAGSPPGEALQVPAVRRAARH